MDLTQEVLRLQTQLRTWGGNGKWLLRGSFLHRAKHDHGWDTRGSNTFGQFVRGLGPQLGAKEALLWREMKAYVYYLELRNRWPGLPDETALHRMLMDGGKIVGAGHLDALERIEQVAPPSEFKDIVTALFTLSSDGKCTYTRSQLEERWRILKDALKGHAPRGRNAKQELDQARVEERLVLARLMASDGRWLIPEREDSAGEGWFIDEEGTAPGDEAEDGSEISRYELFVEVVFGPNWTCDAVAVVVGDWTRPSRPEFHGIEVCNDPEAIARRPGFNAFMRAFDFFWIAFPAQVDISAFMQAQRLPGAGVVQVDDKGVRMCRRPAPERMLPTEGRDLPASGHGTGDLAMRLLAQKLKKA